MDGSVPDNGFGDVLKWQVLDRIAGRKRDGGGPFVTPRRDNDGAAVAADRPSLTWVGHASLLLRLGGSLIATDPVFASRMGPRRRLTPPGVPPSRIPAVDIVTVSHSHYDHLDLPSLRHLASRGSPRFVVPTDCGEILRASGIDEVVELGWWESIEIGAVRVTCVPAQHWSMRVPWDRNARLWGGFVYESADGVAYHAGDTAFSEQVFRAIATASRASTGPCCPSAPTTRRGSWRRSTWAPKTPGEHGQSSGRTTSLRCTGAPSS